MFPYLSSTSDVATFRSLSEHRLSIITGLNCGTDSSVPQFLLIALTTFLEKMTLSAVPPSLRDICRRLSSNDDDLVSLDLAGFNIGNSGAIALGRALDHNTNLHSLSLCYNLISAAGAVPLLSSQGATRVRTLDLRYNSIGDDGAEALARGLSMNPNLQNLSLRNNFIGPVGAASLCEALETNTTVEHLDLGTNAIGKAGVAAISKMLQTNKTLRCLSLWSNHLDAECIQRIAMGLRFNTTLEVLNLGGNEIGDRGAQALADVLKYNTTLRSLHMANSQICGEGALALARVLTTNTRLRLVDILHNPIGLEGAAAFRSVLRSSNRTIHELRLDYQFTAIDNFCFKGVNDEITIYLKLNQNGRAHMTNVRLPWGSWPNILAKVNVQADLMYLTLHEKPDLLQRE